jgi:predicted TIM-barrel enzyme
MVILQKLFEDTEIPVGVNLLRQQLQKEAQ